MSNQKKSELYMDLTLEYKYFLTGYLSTAINWVVFLLYFLFHS